MPLILISTVLSLLIGGLLAAISRNPELFIFCGSVGLGLSTLYTIFFYH